MEGVVPFTALNYDKRVAFVDAYVDGTVTIAFEDSQGQKAVVCIDRRKRSPTRNRLFDQARHPNKPEAVLIELGSLEEAHIVPLISRWVERGHPSKQEFTEFGQELVLNAIMRVGEPSAGRDDRTLQEL